ncbi:hypothetical protein [uncultured Tenacibaculum sp.]|uniref:hypothetical protein n=1 Tax=uncultured Tenacibaculum sp. TaxID=174713 RepID=UPI002616727B|nr:hypothetical protein [uncultured Tenacibaculum sp.]
MKMTLDQLRVDSYAAQVNENELTEIKGGTSPVCLIIVGAMLLTSCTEKKECTKVTTKTCADGSVEATTEKVNCKDYE